MLASRRFTSTPVFISSAKGQHPETPSSLLSYIHDNVVGNNETFSGPFGPRRVVYCDYTASGKALRFVESFILTEVLPLYGNTHSTVSVTAEQTTVFVHEARDVIRNSVRAGEHDVVLFVGSGTTAAVNTLVHMLGLRDRPATCIVGPFEHHSNLLPWRESCRRVLTVSEDELGQVDLNHLRELLAKCRSQNPDELLIGAFSACSNVTGILTDVDRVSVILHEFGALAFWDYASAAPYVHIDMHPVSSESAWKDAVFFSGHKFVGGCQTPGVLVVRKSVVANELPVRVGGGTVFFVRRDSHRYLRELENREEGGTPDSVGEIRLGMVFQLKNAVSTGLIESRERFYLQKAVDSWRSCENIKILGNTTLPRLPIISIVISHPGKPTAGSRGLHLHCNFVTAVLDDVYGIQTRSGCLCAGPYAQELLGIDDSLAGKFEAVLAEDPRLDRGHLRRKGEYSEFEVLRPGVTRLNLPYFATEEEIEFIVEAVAQVSREGWKLLPQYRMNPETGEWHHTEQPVFTARKWLGHISYADGRMDYNPPHIHQPFDPPESFQACLDAASKIYEQAASVAKKINIGDERTLFEPVKSLRWFLLPIEAKLELSGKDAPLPESPFYPKVYPNEPLAADELERIWNSYRGASERSSAQVETLPRKQGGGNHTPVSATNAPIPTKNGPLPAGESAKRIGFDLNRLSQESTTSEEAKVEPARPVSREDWSSGHRVMSRDPGDSRPLRYEWRQPPTAIFKPMCEAIKDLDMIKDGDKILVCLSGGKDSLSLLHSLRQYQFYAKGTHSVSFELGAITVDPGSASYNPAPLIEYLDGLNLTYLYEEQRIFDKAMSMEEMRSICAFCSRMKRGRLYAAARSEGWNVLAFGQHLDDLAESFLMSVFYNGALRTMKACYTVKEGDLRVIRPLAYVREKTLRDFAEGSALPVIPENCPACFEAPKQRHRTKQLLATQEVMFPNLFQNILSALKPLMTVVTTETAAMRDEAVSRILSVLGHEQDEE